MDSVSFTAPSEWWALLRTHHSWLLELCILLLQCVIVVLVAALDLSTRLRAMWRGVLWRHIFGPVLRWVLLAMRLWGWVALWALNVPLPRPLVLVFSAGQNTPKAMKDISALALQASSCGSPHIFSLY
jgi:hypothetical protein